MDGSLGALDVAEDGSVVERAGQRIGCLEPGDRLAGVTVKRRGAIIFYPLLLCLVLGCSRDDSHPSASDTDPPGAIGDLAVTDTSATSVTLAWSAPSEDGASGGAVSSYDLRYRLQTLEGIPWDSLSQATGEPTPADPATVQTCRLGGLLADTLYAIALRSIDDAGLLSPPSNIVSVRTKVAADTIAPGAILDLRAADTTVTSITLAWSAPAEDGKLGGKVASYDLRYRLGTLDSGVWDRATRADSLPDPAEPRTPQSYVLNGLFADTLYAIAIRSTDDAGLVSPLSVILRVRTKSVPDTIPPDPVTDLEVAEIGSSSVKLTWTATGDDGLSGRARSYDLRYREESLDAGSWEEAFQVDGEPIPGPPGTVESCIVPGLNPETTYGFALRVLDDRQNVSGISNPVEATTVARARDFVDPQGIDVDPVNGDAYVAGGSTGLVYRISKVGEISAVNQMRIPGLDAVNVRWVGAGLLYVIAGTERLDLGGLWRLGGISQQPLRLDIAGQLRFPSDADILSGTVSLVLAERDSRHLVKYDLGRQEAQTLHMISAGQIIGLIADGGGAVYYYGVRLPGTSLIQRWSPDTGAPTDIHFLGDHGEIGDLVSDPDDAERLWYLDRTKAAVLRVMKDGSTLDTLATSLRKPVAIGPVANERFFYYSSGDGYVLKATRRGP